MTHSTARRALVAAFALLTLPGVAACSMTNPVTSKMSYEPADGVSAHTGDVTLRNMVVIGEKKGAPAVLSAAAYNAGASEAKVTLTVGEGDTIELTVPAHGTRLIGPVGKGATGGADGTVTALPVEPGRLMDVRVSTGTGGATVKVPVHGPEGIYSSYTPAPAATDEPTGTAPATSDGSTTAPAPTSTPATAQPATTTVAVTTG